MSLVAQRGGEGEKGGYIWAADASRPGLQVVGLSVETVINMMVGFMPW